MKTQLLLPPNYRKIGYWMLIPSVVFGLFCLTDQGSNLLDFKIWWPKFLAADGFIVIRKVEIANTIAIALNLFTFAFIALSREKVEDECIDQIRARAMIKALWYSLALSLISTLLCFSFLYLYVLIFNLYFYLIFYIVIFRTALAKFYKSQSDE